MSAMHRTCFVFFLVLALGTPIPSSLGQGRLTYENSLVLVTLCVDYTSKTAAQFASEANELKRRLFQIPYSRFYSHQIPADLIFGESDNPRIRTSASYIETAVLEPFGGTGVTAFNGWDGRGS
jgi:hypothetical protein